MTTHDETYNGWTNRETWAVALHINNDQGWQESVHESLRELVADNPDPDTDETLTYRAGETIRDNVEETLDALLYDGIVGRESHNASRDAASFYRGVVSDIGSLWRVNWTELGQSFLEDISED